MTNYLTGKDRDRLKTKPEGEPVREYRTQDSPERIAMIAALHRIENVRTRLAQYRAGTEMAVPISDQEGQALAVDLADLESRIDNLIDAANRADGFEV